ncbi:uncharacterized protein B0T23DRAFT_417637 [Neurospora hispaniola]|uniref:Arrestin-like N-terminal domain-containing protein n=1 Tax=Neurospora hispaniola TaxID=588809 RepID=A0AAJ0IH39_9PEZI|nr:hypothetical protein B0T23DRAFT_417637 [Neurospora hispaniola]
MSIRIALENPPEFYTNLDIIRGQVVLTLSRPEQIGGIIVKLEGEAKSALGVPADGSGTGIAQRERTPTGDVIYENHKILYKVTQAFPDEKTNALPQPYVLAAGQHRFPFQFKFPFNNACGDPVAMAKLGGLSGAGGIASGSGLFGLGGIRVMDGTKQLMYSHVTKTLPPSFTGFPGQCEIRYYVKVTIQRPGFFKENWRMQTGLKFLPIEPPRPPKTNHEAYARRPFAFRPRSPRTNASSKKRASFFSGWTGSSNAGSTSAPTTTADGKLATEPEVPPSIEMSARLPHPAIITCNQPIPLRLIAKKLAGSDAEIFLTAIQIDLIGQTEVRCHDLINTETSRWVIVSRQGLSIPVSRLGDPAGTEVVLPNDIWCNQPLPNTVMPSFVTCNLSREYQLEVKLGLSWGKPVASISHATTASSIFGRNKNEGTDLAQEIHLPLHFSSVEVYSGIAPPAALIEAMKQGKNKRTQSQRPPSQSARPTTSSSSAETGPSTAPQQQPPALPPRTNTAQPPTAAGTVAGVVVPPPADPLYPPQLAPGEMEPPYDDAPPSYDEAMAEIMSGPVIPDGVPRPAYSGVTNENEPSTLPAGGNEKS